jgi:spectinomycin phosphotransferase/16S rRNA (guanine(1405)-N(7))-methyltransferase
MYSKPTHLADQAVIEALAEGWNLTPVTVDYLAVGFGSYHWRAAGRDGRPVFVTVDDLAGRQRSPDEPWEAVHRRLRAALRTAAAVARAGAPFVVAPLPAADGEVLRRLGDQFSIAVYPWVAGRTRGFGETLTAAGRQAVLRLLVTLHGMPGEIRDGALAEEFAIPYREDLAKALTGLAGPWGGGPYGDRARTLLAEHANAVEHLLHHYDRLAGQARAQQHRRVLTHGEPHPGNLIEAASGWLLIDWDTTLAALPERDLWLLDPGDGTIGGDYERAGGGEVRPAMLALYRLQWELTDLAGFIVRFTGEHGDTEDDRVSWAAVAGYLPRAQDRSEEIASLLRQPPG